VDFIIAAKRVSKERAPHCEYWWEGPDGTRVLATRLGKDARANGFFQGYIPARFGMEYLSEDFKFRWGLTGQVLHRAAPAEAHEDYFRIDRETGYHADKIPAAFEAAWRGMDETLAPDLRLILCGSDFSTPQEPLPRMILDAGAAMPEIDWRMGSIEEYAALLPAQLEGQDVPVVRGELRDGPACSCSGNALPVRIPIKQLNKAAENALIRRAEPLAAAMTLHGEPYPTALLNLAWKHLLQAHPHDSINGVTQDKTADDTTYRIRQAIELGKVVEEETVARLVRRLDTRAYAADAILLLVVNPLPQPRREILKVCVDTPQEASAWEVDLFDANGIRLDTQFAARRQMTCPVHDLESRPWPFDFDRHTIYVDAGEIPAGGYKVLEVRTRRAFNRSGEWWPEMRATPGGEISANARSLENEFLRVEVRPDGSLDLTDKKRGRSFPGIHYFEDTGDIGDYWAYYPPHANQTFSSQGGTARVWLEDNGPLAATIAVEHVLHLPAGAVMPEKTVIGDSRRTDATTGVRITSRFTLHRGSDRLNVRTTIENTAEDHRMRLMLPTGLQADFSQSAGHFTVDERPIIPPRDERGEFWPEMQTQPMGMFVSVSNGAEGFSVLSNSFTEYQLLDDPVRTIAITLFRAVRARICTEFRSSGHFPDQKGAQLLRTLEYEYALCPHAGDWQAGDVPAKATAFNVPPGTFQFSPASKAGDLPTEKSLYSISGGQFSAFKKSEDSADLIVRAFNPGGGTTSCEVRLPSAAKSALETNLNEEPVGRVKSLVGGKLSFPLAAAKIRTWKISQDKAAK
jgi:mannosylglycerate hydrolase